MRIVAQPYLNQDRAGHGHVKATSIDQDEFKSQKAAQYAVMILILYSILALASGCLALCNGYIPW